MIRKNNLKKYNLSELKDDTIFHQVIRLSRNNDQGYCDPTTRTQATFVWFPEENCTIFQVAKYTLE